jgi:hypothetical protein
MVNGQWSMTNPRRYQRITRQFFARTRTGSSIANRPSFDKLRTGCQSPIPNLQSAIRLYPDIGLGMLRTELTAPGRLWLLFHHLDPQGRGVLRVDIIREQQLTRKTSSHYLCGKRQLRNLLRAGEGVFWTRDKRHIWLRSAGRVAYGLGVGRLTGQPVALPLSALLSGIGEFRAHLYAAFHSGRAKGGEAGMPIARDTLADLSGAAANSQRTYEARLRLRPQTNYAIGEVVTEQNKEERAWQQGQAIFELNRLSRRARQAGKKLSGLAAAQQLQRAAPAAAKRPAEANQPPTQRPGDERDAGER